jgi:hypothetical protein
MRVPSGEDIRESTLLTGPVEAVNTSVETPLGGLSSHIDTIA